MKTQAAGYEEVRHTADWALHVWAPDLPALVEQAAHGMYALEGVDLAAEPRVERRIVVSGDDPESLLVAFLNELLYLQETENLAFEQLRCRLSDHHLEAEAHGRPIQRLNKAIKAATFHNLTIRKTPRGYETTLIFDV